eukprot:68446-Hanusia_phi.AAC.2
MEEAEDLRVKKIDMTVEGRKGEANGAARVGGGTGREWRGGREKEEEKEGSGGSEAKGEVDLSNVKLEFAAEFFHDADLIEIRITVVNLISHAFVSSPLLLVVKHQLHAQVSFLAHKPMDCLPPRLPLHLPVAPLLMSARHLLARRALPVPADRLDREEGGGRRRRVCGKRSRRVVGGHHAVEVGEKARLGDVATERRSQECGSG